MYSNLLLQGGGEGCGGGRRGQGESFHATPNRFHPRISQIVSHCSAGAAIQTGTKETSSIFLPNWSFPGVSLGLKDQLPGQGLL